MSTNGSKAAYGPKGAQIVREVTYYAAIDGWYDTSEATQHAGQ